MILRVHRVTAPLVCIFFTGVCIAQGVNSPLPSAGSVPADWQKHSDPMGFSARFPRDWSVDTNPDLGNIEFRGAEGDRVIVWPVLTTIALQTDSAVKLVTQLARKLWPAVQLQSAEPVGKSAVRVPGAAGDRIAVFSLVWVNSPKGTAAFLYVTSARHDRYAAASPTFVAILGSLEFAGADGAGSAPRAAPVLEFVRFADPKEHAFDVDLPNGWKAAGGAFRYAALDVRLDLSAVSPDGSVRIFAGDHELPTFTIPNQVLDFAGFSEGKWYSPGYGETFLVKRYKTGVEFLKEYVASRYGGKDADLRIVHARDLPEAAEQINKLYARTSVYGIQHQLSTGEISFTFRREGRPMHGHLFAGTTVIHMQGNGLWHVSQLFGFVATEEQLPAAVAASSRLLKTFRINPDWARMQAGIAGKVSQIVAETNACISTLINDSYWTRQRIYDRVFQKGSDARRGIDRVYDEHTGRSYEIDSGSNYYWIDYRGNIVGTDTYTRPDIDYRELVRQ